MTQDDLLAGAAPDDSIHLDGDGVILRAGSLFSRLAGLSEEVLAGTPLMDLIAPDDHERCSDAIQSAYLGMPKQVNCVVITPGGPGHHVRWLFRQVAGGVGGALLHLEGQTLVPTEVEAGRYRALLRIIPGYIFILDGEGRFKELHPPESGELVFPPEVAIGKHVLDLFSPQIAEMTMAAIAKSGRGELASFIYSLLIHGKDRHFEAYVAASGEDEVVIFALDRTDEHEVQEHLRDHLRMERTLTEIFDLVMHNHTFAESADEVLSIIGGVMGADRISLVIITQNQTMQRLYNWEAPSVSPLPSSENDLPMDAFSWWYEQLVRGEVLIIEDPGDLPLTAVAERDLLMRIGTRSLIAFPIRTDSGVFGFVAVQNPKDPSAWRDEESRFIRMAGEIIGHAFFWEQKVKENSISKHI
jgi:PAS domain-containing protein